MMILDSGLLFWGALYIEMPEDCVRLTDTRSGVCYTATELSVMLDHDFGTICRRTSDSRTYLTADSDGHL